MCLPCASKSEKWWVRASAAQAYECLTVAEQMGQRLDVRG